MMFWLFMFAAWMQMHPVETTGLPRCDDLSVDMLRPGGVLCLIDVGAHPLSFTERPGFWEALEADIDRAIEKAVVDTDDELRCSLSGLLTPTERAVCRVHSRAIRRGQAEHGHKHVCVNEAGEGSAGCLYWVPSPGR